MGSNNQRSLLCLQLLTLLIHVAAEASSYSKQHWDAYNSTIANIKKNSTIKYKYMRFKKLPVN